MGADECGDRGVWIRDWAIRDCDAAADGAARACVEDDGDFRCDGDDFNFGGRSDDDRGRGAIPEDAGASG